MYAKILLVGSGQQSCGRACLSGLPAACLSAGVSACGQAAAQATQRRLRVRSGREQTAATRVEWALLGKFLSAAIAPVWDSGAAKCCVTENLEEVTEDGGTQGTH